MIPHKQNVNVKHTILETLSNKHLSRSRCVVENAFGILKKKFRKLLLKSNLSIDFILDIVICHCMVYNLILDGRDVDVDALMFQLEVEN
jgi:hypothetical protein